MKRMRICALTMVYRDHWALSQWYRHFSRALGASNLYIVAHGPDPEIRRLCPDSSIITIPRDRFDHFDLVRNRMLNRLQNGLNEVFDWVIRTDADELICLDPAHHDGFAGFLDAHHGDAAFALGLNLAEAATDAALPDGAAVFRHRRHAEFSAHYSKAWAVRNRVGLMRHGVQVKPRKAAAFDFRIPEGVYLVHLKFANSRALSEANRHRREVAGSDATGLPGPAWQDPQAETRKFFTRFQNLPEAPWEDARRSALAEIGRAPVRDIDRGIVRARNARQDRRTLLPDWFSEL